MNSRNETNGGADRPPTEDELLAMAYADGELSAEDLVRFELRLESEPGLTHMVAEHHALDVLARRVAPPEPADHQWKRLRSDPVFRSSVGLGWTLVIVSAVISFVLAVWGVGTNEALSLLTRLLILGSLFGFVLLFLTVLWRRLSTYSLDPYRHVER
ncbi:MAG: hypothetical protein AAF726_06915 [Planctomycetota bacterium]